MGKARFAHSTLGMVLDEGDGLSDETREAVAESQAWLAEFITAATGVVEREEDDLVKAKEDGCILGEAQEVIGVLEDMGIEHVPVRKVAWLLGMRGEEGE